MSSPDTTTKPLVEPLQADQSDLKWVKECKSVLNSLRGGEYKTNLSPLCTTPNSIPVPHTSMDRQPEDGLPEQDIIMWDATTDSGTTAETIIFTDSEMLDYSEDPAYVCYCYAEEPEQMDWEPCFCTDADNDIVMRGTE